jgi:hypothetical protein
VQQLFADGTVYIGEYISDDDSLLPAVLSHSYQDLIEAGLIPKQDWLKYKNGASSQRKPNNGQLPINHPVIPFKANKRHWVRGYSIKNFTLANSPKSKNFGVTEADTKRMKSRTLQTLRIRTDGGFEEFQICLAAVSEHHFDNHEHCGDWCKVKERMVRRRRKII